MSTPYCINFPRLHEKLVEGARPEHTIFLASAFFSDGGESTSPAVREFAKKIAASFPAPLKTALTSARQLQEYGANLWESRQLEALAAMNRNAENASRQLAGELKDINLFIAGQSTMSKTDSKINGTDIAQTETMTKLLFSKELALCITFDMESAILETRQAIKKLETANALLMTSLHDENRPEEHAALTGLDLEPEITISYISVLDAILPFVPDGTVLFTNDKDTLHLLKESRTIEAPQTDRQVSHDQIFTYQPITVWKLLGLPDRDPRLPWTENTVVLCYPAAHNSQDI